MPVYLTAAQTWRRDQTAEYVRRMEHGLGGNCFGADDSALHKRCMLTSVFFDGKTPPQRLDMFVPPKNRDYVGCLGAAIQIVVATGSTPRPELQAGALQALTDMLWQWTRPNTSRYTGLMRAALESMSGGNLTWLLRHWRLISDVLPLMPEFLEKLSVPLLHSGGDASELEMVLRHWDYVEPLSPDLTSARVSRLVGLALKYYKPEYAETLAHLLGNLSRTRRLGTGVNFDPCDFVQLDRLKERIRFDAPTAFLPVTRDLDYATLDPDVLAAVDYGDGPDDPNDDDDDDDDDDEGWADRL